MYRPRRLTTAKAKSVRIHAGGVVGGDRHHWPLIALLLLPSGGAKRLAQPVA